MLTRMKGSNMLLVTMTSKASDTLGMYGKYLAFIMSCTAFVMACAAASPSCSHV